MTHLVEEIINPALLSEIADSTQQGFLYAIVDCAFDLGIRKPLRKWSSVPLYQATELADLAPYSPELYLVDEKQQPHNIEQLITLCKGQPMLSFIRSPLELMPLKEHLEYLLKVYCEDNTEWPLRYADTRILIPLFDVLTEEQQKILLGPLQHWFIPDRFGMIQDITGENQPDKKWQAAMGSLKMGEIQFTAMVDAAMPDSILSTIRDEYSSILLPYSSGDQYKRVVQGIKDAKELHLHGSQDILQIALIQLMSAEAPLTSSEYQLFKNKIKSGDELADSINHLPAEFWRKNN